METISEDQPSYSQISDLERIQRLNQIKLLQDYLKKQEEQLILQGKQKQLQYFMQKSQSKIQEQQINLIQKKQKIVSQRKQIQKNQLDLQNLLLESQKIIQTKQTQPFVIIKNEIKRDIPQPTKIRPPVPSFEQNTNKPKIIKNTILVNPEVQIKQTIEEEKQVEMSFPEFSAPNFEGVYENIAENKQMEMNIEKEDTKSEDSDDSLDDSTNDNSSEEKKEVKLPKYIAKRYEALIENIERLFIKLNLEDEKLKKFTLQLATKIITNELYQEHLKNRPYEAMAAALIAHAARIIQYPLTVKKIAKHVELREKTLNKIFMFIKKNIEECMTSNMHSPEIFLEKIAKNLNLTEKIQAGARHIIKNMDNKGIIDGQHAGTVAAVAVKIACHLNNVYLGFKNLETASDVCQISLRSYYRAAYPHRCQIVEDLSLFSNLPQFLPSV